MDERTLVAMREVALAVRDTGDLARAEELVAELIPRMREALGPAHEGTRAALLDLASLRAEGGRYEAAFEGFEELVALERELEDASLHATLNNYGAALVDAGRLDEAEKVLTESVELTRARMGKRHPETLWARSVLADLYSDMGKLRESERIQRKLVDDFEEVFGADHPEYGQVCSNLGALYNRRGRSTRARPLLEKAVPIMEATLGPEHPRTLIAIDNLAVACSSTGDLQRASELRGSLLEIQRRVRGPAHPQTLNSMNNLAILYRDLERYEESLELLRETWRLSCETLGADHPETLTVLDNIGGGLFVMDRHEEALEVNRDVVAGRLEVLDDDHPDITKSFYNSAMILRALGDPEATPAFEEVLRRIEATGTVDEIAVSCRARLGEAALDVGDRVRALAFFTDAVEARRELGAGFEELAYLLHQAGYCLAREKRWDDACVVLREAVELRTAMFGESGPITLLSVYVLAGCEARGGRHEVGLDLALRYHDAKLEQTGELGPDLAQARKLVADILDLMERPEDAARWREPR